MTVPPKSKTIPNLLIEQSRRFPDREALVAGNVRMTYAQLYTNARQVAKGFMAMGIERDDHVAILMGNRSEWIISFLALQCLGATAVGLNTWATQRELTYAIAHADVKLMVAISAFKKANYQQMFESMAPLEDTFPKLKNVVWLLPENEPARPADKTWAQLLVMATGITDERLDIEMSAVEPSTQALLLYTSGSSAAPKGILLQQRQWIENAWNIGERQHVTEQDRLWMGISLFWTYASVNALANILSHGACAVLQEYFNAEEAVALIERERCSIFYGTPNITQALFDVQSRTPHDLTSLRSGAMIGTTEQMLCAVNLGAYEICNVYGLSETYGNCTVTDAHDSLDIRLNSVGKPLPDVVLRICDIENENLLGTGLVGEIRVKGPLFSGYYKDEKTTREAYDVDGYFKTGDLGSLDEDGRLYFRGRLKEMIKSGGINIAPIEIEETLMRVPSVSAAYVVGLPDTVLDEVLGAVIVPRSGEYVDIDALRTLCKQELAAYKVPSRFLLVDPDDLPMTSTGKVHKARMYMLFSSEKKATLSTVINLLSPS